MPSQTVFSFRFANAYRMCHADFIITKEAQLTVDASIKKKKRIKKNEKKIN